MRDLFRGAVKKLSNEPLVVKRGSMRPCRVKRPTGGGALAAAAAAAPPSIRGGRGGEAYIGGGEGQAITGRGWCQPYNTTSVRTATC